jgi:PKD repeat protein
MLTVTDSQGSTGSTSQSVTVTVPVTPPVVTISNIAPNPANTGQIVTVTFTVSSTATVTGVTVNWGDGTTDALAGTSTSDTHAYTAAGSFTVTVTATNSAGPGSATIQETVTAVTGNPVLLTFQAQAPQSPSKGPGILQVFVNGQHVTDVTPGMINFTNFGPIDITTFVTFGGQNTVTFVNPQTNQFSLVKNVTVTQGNTILLHVVRTQKVSAGGTLTFTFSLPALATTGITVSSTGPLVDQIVTFTAKFTGGTAPFKCIFQFGDDESAVSQGMSGTCTATHDFDSSGTFTTTLVIKGASTSDRVVAHLHVNVQESSDIDDD